MIELERVEFARQFLGVQAHALTGQKLFIAWAHLDAVQDAHYRALAQTDYHVRDSLLAYDPTVTFTHKLDGRGKQKSGWSEQRIRECAEALQVKFGCPLYLGGVFEYHQSGTACEVIAEALKLSVTRVRNILKSNKISNL